LVKKLTAKEKTLESLLKTLEEIRAEDRAARIENPRHLSRSLEEIRRVQKGEGGKAQGFPVLPKASCGLSREPLNEKGQTGYL